MKKLIIILFLGLSSHLSVANSTKASMRDVFESYVELFPYLYGDKKDNIELKIKNLESSFEKAKHSILIKKNNFMPIAKIFQETLAESKSAAGEKNYSYAKYRLKKAISVCISCHSQLPAMSYPKIANKYSESAKKHIKTNYDKAMLSYFLRDYKNAIKFFKKEYSSSSYKNIDILNKILGIYITNLNDRIGARDYLLSLNELPKSVSYQIKDIISQLNKPYKNQGIKKLMKELNSLKDELNIDLSNIVVSSNLRRELNQYMISSKDDSMMSEVLYSLGILHKNKGDIYLYSLSDLYFKKCILDYPNSAFAKKCYKAYEQSINFGFTGSSGTHIPASLKKELAKLKALIN